ncbi:HNH endonuclease [Budvicia aquatica]|uniref:HNH endonuclease n=1 Tax=Budvicia aquatica TaxID=82979 RepID=A0A2C6DEU7_9GAMM|nr:HNH endonuclease [Budvicia aquatica]PHI29716.1 HNH endonuclease [Budvicia aquatica]VFS48102.1 Predicted restriction endonuclease [Budvicia aquatica]
MSNYWSEEELEVTVQAYFDMYSKYLGKIPFAKTAYYKALHLQFGRSEKAFEYRMQNISYVITQLGMEFLPGLKPAKNIGEKNYLKVEAIIKKITQDEDNLLPPEKQFLQEISSSYEIPPEGVKKPSTKLTTVIQRRRSLKVKDWVLNQANGICESCKQPAPFYAEGGKPYLEVHHIKHLSNNGSDTITNSVAICPNCHKAFHYSENSLQLIEQAYSTLTRLIRE